MALKACLDCARENLRNAGRGLCSGCYNARARAGTLEERELSRNRQPAGCGDCEKRPYARGFCQRCYSRARANGSLSVKTYRRRERNSTWQNNGYRYVTTPDGTRAEHRVVMAEIIGRDLFSHENVHHKNGVRSDNRPENLELWTKPQPVGQRIEDLVSYIVANHRELVLAELNQQGAEGVCPII